MNICIFQLNAWDPKHTEEPDYMRRLNAHKKVNEAIKRMEATLDVDFLLPVLHSCCYCIKLVRLSLISYFKDFLNNSVETWYSQKYIYCNFDKKTLENLFVKSCFYTNK